MSRMTTVLKLTMLALVAFGAQLAVAVEPTRRQPTPADATEVLLRKYLEALDRLDIDGAKLIAKRAAEQSPGPITELMVRHTRLLATGKSAPLPSERTRQESGTDRKNVLYTVTYNVADLVLPVPTIVSKGKQADVRADFQPLIDLITSTVKPTTWDAVGGPGSVAPFEVNFSIVVSQTQAVHEEIVDLLEHLRRLQDVSVMLETRLVVLPEEWMSKEGLDKNVRGDTMIGAEQVKQLVDAARKTGDTAVPRRVTLMNGQAATIPVFLGDGDTRRLYGQTTVSNDRRFVRLMLGADSSDAQNRHLASAFVADGKTLVVDLTPLKARSQADAKSAVARRLLLLTPRIIIAEEEEEKLGILPTAGKK
jgi:hypothetical protein